MNETAKLEEYNKLCQVFETKSCKLTTTYEEFIELRKLKAKDRIKVEFTTSCGHSNTVTVTNFIYKSSGVICKDCMKNVIREKIIEYNKEPQIASIGHINEAMLFKKLQDILKNKFEIIKSDEGCTADFIIRPNEITEDKWLLIQIKTTVDICHHLYSFTIFNKNYDNCVMILFCINQNKMWIFDGILVSHIKLKLNIGYKNSKYNKYLVNDEEISEKLLEFYKSKQLFEKEESIHSKQPNRIREEKYKQIREQKLDFIKFEYPEIEQCYYDFTINNIKIQEKVATKRINRTACYVAFLCRTIRSGKVPYKYGMNKYYWINIPDSTIFYLLPEDELYKYKMLYETIEKNTCGMSIALTGKDKWYNNYKYDYDNINREEFMKLFEVEN